MIRSSKASLFQLYFFLLLVPLLLFVQTVFPHKIPRLSPYNKQASSILTNPNKKSNDDLKTYFYKQTLDHFNYAPQSYETFRQRYVVSTKHWGGPNSKSPIFAYLGAEDSIGPDLETIGFPFEVAPYFKSLTVFIEHRVYGRSTPFGTMEEALKNVTTRGYFNSAQALADYADILLYVKRKFKAHKSPIIVLGGSYGGMLAAWFRLKYPHIAHGALASSAPILYFDNITPQNGYYSIVSKDFRDVSHGCFKTIRKSWSKIDQVAARPGGLAYLRRRFRTCSPLSSATELKDYLDTTYTAAAQYNSPPNYPVEMVCKGIDEAKRGTDIIGRIFAGLVSYIGNLTCYQTKSLPTPTDTAWEWQTCSEMVVPIGVGKKGNMFPASPFNYRDYAKECHAIYGVPPRPHWVTTYYGGHDIKFVLKWFGSNIIFSNGLRDPYSSGGVLKHISKSIVAVTTVNGSHCLDIVRSTKDDPEWLVMQRKVEVKIIKGWLSKYYSHHKHSTA